MFGWQLIVGVFPGSAPLKVNGFFYFVTLCAIVAILSMMRKMASPISQIYFDQLRTTRHLPDFFPDPIFFMNDFSGQIIIIL